VLSRIVVEANVHSAPMSTATPLTICASKTSAYTVVGGEPAKQPELDLAAVIEPAHVDDVGADEVAEPARRARPAVEARQ
jgi:hypothetical protein